MRKKETLENTFKELSVITEELENGELSFDEAVKKYKKGMELIKNCNKMLNDAKLQVETVIMDDFEQSEDEENE